MIIRQVITYTVTICIILIVTNCVSSAQKKNSIRIHRGGHIYRNVLDYSKKKDLIGISADMALYKNLSAQVCYSVLRSTLKKNNEGYAFVYDYDAWDTFNIGQIVARAQYHYYDASVAYNGVINIKHKVTISAGATYARGVDAYKTAAWIAPGNSDFNGIVLGQKASYWGGLLAAGYSYMVFRDRVSIGADGIYRTYSGNYPSFFNYRLRVGYHF